MHTIASSLVAIAQYFWRIRTSLFFVYQQKFNIEAVNDYPPIWFDIRFERKFPIHRSLFLIYTVFRKKFFSEHNVQTKKPSTILKIIKSPYFNEKSSSFHEIWYTTADLELDDITWPNVKIFKIQDGGWSPYWNIVFGHSSAAVRYQ